jgi:hypothetical protein
MLTPIVLLTENGFEPLASPWISIPVFYTHLTSN